MSTRATSFCLFATLVFAACSGGGTNRPEDGGRLFCNKTDTVLPVTVVYVDGGAVEGATVTARNDATQQTITGTTDSQGTTTSITPDIGDGTLTVTATKGSQVSNPAQARWTCGDCACTADPNSLKLTLNP